MLKINLDIQRFGGRGASSSMNKELSYYKKLLKFQQNRLKETPKDAEVTRDAINNAIKFAQDKIKQIEAGEKLTKNAEKGVLSDIKDFLSGKENYNGTKNEFINDLSNEWGVNRSRVEDILHDEMIKHPRNFKSK